MSLLGHAEISDVRFDITRIYLDGGELKMAIELPPSAREVRGRIRLFGRDGGLVVIGKTVIIPAHGFWARFTYGLAINQVLSMAETVDLGELPGWR